MTSHGSSRLMEPLSRSTSRASSHHISPREFLPWVCDGMWWWCVSVGTTAMGTYSTRTCMVCVCVLYVKTMMFYTSKWSESGSPCGFGLAQRMTSSYFRSWEHTHTHTSISLSLSLSLSLTHSLTHTHTHTHTHIHLNAPMVITVVLQGMAMSIWRRGELVSQNAITGMFT